MAASGIKRHDSSFDHTITITDAAIADSRIFETGVRWLYKKWT